MIQYLEAYCDINEINYAEWLVAVWTYLQENSDIDLKSFSRFTYLIDAFQQLLVDKISLEEFMKIGDITSEKVIEYPSHIADALSEIEKWLVNNSDEYANCCIIIDPVSIAVSSSAKKDQLEKKLNDIWSVLFCIE